jgi:probable HAF family extracellular repeat protein
MNKKLLRSLVILALAFFAGKCELLTAQSADIKRSHPDTGAMGPAKAKGYGFRSIDYPGNDDSDLYDFNGKTAVGCTRGEAFTFHGSSYALLNIPGATEHTASCAYGISTSGKIVGNYDDSLGQFHGFLYDGSGYTIFDYPGSVFTQPSDINDAGLIVGQYCDSNGVYHGFLYDNGTFTAIDFPGAGDTYANGINSSGDIVGSYNYPANNFLHGFLLSNGAYSSLDAPLATETSAQGINDAGTIAGYYIDTNVEYHGFIYAGGVFTTVDVSGAPVTGLFRIKNNGTVVATVVDSLNEYHGIIGK